MKDALLKIAISETPAVIALVQGLFARRNPSAPLPTDAEVIAAFNEAFRSSIDKDDRWLAAHPE